MIFYISILLCDKLFTSFSDYRPPYVGNARVARTNFIPITREGSFSPPFSKNFFTDPRFNWGLVMPIGSKEYLSLLLPVEEICFIIFQFILQ